MKFNIFNWLDEQGYEGSKGDEFIAWVLWHGACLKEFEDKGYEFEFPFEKDLDNASFIAIHDKFCAAITETGSYFYAVYAMMDENSAQFALEFTNEYERLLGKFMGDQNEQGMEQMLESVQ